MRKLLGLLILLTFSPIAMAGGDVIGWRGDGTGIYPQANPPVEWQQVSTAVEGLRFQVQPPKNDAPSGQPMPDGVIREWLILGPLPTTKADKDTTDALFNLDQSKLAPASGQKFADSEWKILPTETAYIDFAKQFGTYDKTPEQSVYAFA